MAQSIVPNTFQSGTPAVASEVNENFSALDQAVTDLQDDAPIRTILVSPVPGDAVAGGTALRDALAGITDAAANNRYLIKLEPGDFDLGSAGLFLPSFIDIEGSGWAATRLIIADQIISFGDNVEIRSLTVAAIMTSVISRPLVANLSTSSALRDLQVSVSGEGMADSVGGIRNQQQGTLILDSVNVDVVGAGSFVEAIRNDGGGSIDVRNVRTSVSGGSAFNTAFQVSTGDNLFVNVDSTATGTLATSMIIFGTATARVFGSRLSGDTNSIRATNGATTAVANSQLIGPTQDDSGMDLTLVGCYNGSFAPIADTL